MGLAARQLDFGFNEDWINVGEAATLTNESIRAWQHKAAWEARSARQAGRRALARKGAAESGVGKPVWFVHRSIDARLTRFPAKDEREQRQFTALAGKFPQHKVEQAYRKAHWLREWRKLCDGRRESGLTDFDLAERIIVQAREREGEEFPISIRTLKLWHKAYKAKNVEGLIDKRGAGVFNWGEHDGRSPEAVEYFYSLYHVQSPTTVRTCHDNTLREAKRHGWTWPGSYQASWAWLQKYDDLGLTCMLREGREAWQHRYMPHLQRDHTLIEPGDLFVCDHHQLDAWVEHNGEQIRPWFTAVMDDRSRTIVGWHLGPAPHQDAILCALRRAFRDWSIPRNMLIDNGKDFTSKLLTGVTKHTRDRLRTEYGLEWRDVLKRGEALVECVDPRFQGVVHELGVNLIYAIPYAPWSKGILERWFGAFEDQCGKTFATYCGNSTLTRPECLDAIRRGYTKEQKRYLRRRYGKAWKKVAVLKFVDQSAVPTLHAAREQIAEWIEVYHRTAHRGQGMDGACPLAVWNTATALRKADADALTLLMESRGNYKVGPNGVTVKVGSATLTYGGGEPKLYPLRGREVFITLDPDQPGVCCAWTPDEKSRRFIARLACNESISPLATVDDLREASATIQRRRKMYRSADRQAPARTRSVAAELRAQQRDKLAELKATGTDGKPRVVNVEPVRTGFEGLSRPVRTTSDDRAQHDTASLWSALSYGRERAVEEESQPRLTLADLSPRGLLETTTDEEDQGTEAEHTPSDLLGLIAGHRHERNDES